MRVHMTSLVGFCWGAVVRYQSGKVERLPTEGLRQHPVGVMLARQRRVQGQGH